MKTTIKRIGILTGGGDCPGLNAAIRAVAKTAQSKGWQVIGIQDGYEGLVDEHLIPLDARKVSGILTWGGTILGTSNKADPFRYINPEHPAKKPVDRSKEVVACLKRHRIDALVTIGGDGTLTSAAKFHKMGVKIVAIPKTIDNDLQGTDVTIGFDSALTIATDSIDRLHSTAEAHHRVMVVEVMGRYAGWIALRSGIAGGGDVILIPEIPYDIQKVANAIRKREREGKRFSIIVAAEGARPKKGKMTVDRMDHRSPDPVRLGGIGKVVAQELEARDLESRVTVLGHLQRGGSPTAFDRWIATQFGVKAVEALAAGKNGVMVAVRKGEVVTSHLADSVRKLHLVDPKGVEVLAAKAVGTAFGD